MDIVAKEAGDAYQLRDSLLPKPRDLAQLIALSAVAHKLSDVELDRGFEPYSAPWI